ncbi:MAG: HD domain-containing phosphohydrolase [Elusimicrobiota bacterium]|nr:HD domain-containing protein [Endomicrobiia bacterium]MDW8165009.1 HD domain-containing phosphohydrolase [Elusimicrobiota bacterium]
MILFKIINLFAAFFNFALALTITQCKLPSFKELRNINLGVFLLAFSSALWALNMAILLFCVNSPAGEFFARFNWVGGLIVASYTYLSLSMTKQYKKAEIIGLLQFILAVFFTIIAFTKYGIVKVISCYPLQREFGVLQPLFRFWIMVSIIYSVWLTIKHYYNTKGIERLQFQYFTFGLLVYAVIGLVFNSILPLLGNENFIPLTTFFSIIWVLSSFYSIHSYKILDIEVVFCDAIKFSIFIFIGISLNYILVNALTELVSLAPIWSSTLSVIIVGAIYFVTPLRERINNTIRNIVLRKRTSYQKLLENTASAVVEILDLDNLLQYLLKQISDSLGATKICIFLLDEETKDEEGEPVYALAASYGFDEVKEVYFKQKKIINWLKKHKEPFLVDIAYHTMNKQEYMQLVNDIALFGAIIIIPIIYKGELIGIITLDQKKVDGTIFDIEDIEILKTLSEQLAVAIQNSKIYKELNTAYLQITRALSLTLESKDEYLIGHSDNVTKYAVLIAKKLGLSERDIYILAQASVLHDLGKIGIHDYILSKPGKLTKEEWEEMKQHPIKGAKILEALPFLNEVAKVILYHHEHYDGSGYPEGLKGEQIPLLSRILTLADSVDAMLSERPYKERRMTVEEMLKEIISQKGKHFDPLIVDKFVEIIEEYPEIFKITQNNKKNT